MKNIYKYFISILFVGLIFISSCDVSGSDDSSTSIEGSWQVDAGFTEISYMKIDLENNRIRTFFDRRPPTENRPEECYYSIYYEFYKIDGIEYEAEAYSNLPGDGVRGEDGILKMEIEGSKLIVRAEDIGIGNFELSRTDKNLEEIYICN